MEYISSRTVWKHYRQIDLAFCVQQVFFFFFLAIKSATIAFFSSPPFLLLAFSLSLFLFLRFCDFGASRATKPAFWLLFTQLTANFVRSVFKNRLDIQVIGLDKVFIYFVDNRLSNTRCVPRFFIPRYSVLSALSALMQPTLLILSPMYQKPYFVLKKGGWSAVKDKFYR